MGNKILRPKGMWLYDSVNLALFINPPDQLWLIESIEDRIKELKKRKTRIMYSTKELSNYEIDMIDVQITDLKEFKEILIKNCNPIENQSEVADD